jgi:hypothetical protein
VQERRAKIYECFKCWLTNSVPRVGVKLGFKVPIMPMVKLGIGI